MRDFPCVHLRESKAFLSQVLQGGTNQIKFLVVDDEKAVMECHADPEFQRRVLCVELLNVRVSKLVAATRGHDHRRDARPFFCHHYPGDTYRHGPDASKAVAFLKKNLPEHPARILATGRLRTHFMFDFPSAPLTEDYREGDFLIIDLHDPAFEDSGKIEALRHKLYRDPRTRPVTHVNWYGKQIVLLKIVPPGTPHQILCRMIGAELFARAGGRALVSGIDGIQARCDGRSLHFRIDRELSCDYDLFIELKFPGGKVKMLEYTWYFGLFPAWSQKPGTLWSVPLSPGFDAVGVRFKVRPGSELSPSGAGGAPATTPASAGKSSAPPR